MYQEIVRDVQKTTFYMFNNKIRSITHNVDVYIRACTQMGKTTRFSSILNVGCMLHYGFTDHVKNQLIPLLLCMKYKKYTGPMGNM